MWGLGSSCRRMRRQPNSAVAQARDIRERAPELLRGDLDALPQALGRVGAGPHRHHLPDLVARLLKLRRERHQRNGIARPIKLALFVEDQRVCYERRRARDSAMVARALDRIKRNGFDSAALRVI